MGASFVFDHKVIVLRHIADLKHRALSFWRRRVSVLFHDAGIAATVQTQSVVFDQGAQQQWRSVQTNLELQYDVPNLRCRHMCTATEASADYRIYECQNLRRSRPR